jgi:hypothetical protein
VTQEAQDAASPEDLDQLASQVSASKPAAWEQSPIPVREQTRKRIAVILVTGYIILVVGILIYVLCDESAKGDSKDLITLLITSYTTLLGSALGYYFGHLEN